MDSSHRLNNISASLSGVEISGREYFVGATKRVGVSDVCDAAVTKRGGKFGREFLMIGFKDNVDYDLFDLYDMSGSQFSLVASERFMVRQNLIVYLINQQGI